MLRLFFILIVCVACEWFGAAATARAQAPATVAGCKLSTTQNMTGTRLPDDHYVLEGTGDQPVQIDCDDVQFFADHMELFQKEGRLTANGNVEYISGGNRIHAERMEFNTKTRTGTFYNATGTATLREAVQPNIFGAQEPDAFFWGDELQKIGPLMNHASAQFTLPAPQLGPGVYSVQFRALDPEDGHISSGKFTFTIGPGAVRGVGKHPAPASVK